jgi:DNA-binding NarL/FixJ family response regulator
MATRVLIADDSLFIRQAVRNVLESDTDAKVCAEAANGLEAVKKAHEFHPDLTIMDFRMPVMNGLEATRHMKAMIPSMPVVILAFDNSPELERESIEAGADAVVVKVGGITSLTDAVRSLAQRH